MREKIKKRLIEARERYVKHYNLRTRVQKYDIDDIVYRENTMLSDSTKNFSKKLAPRFVKSQIVEKTGTNTYKLKDIDTGKMGVFHATKFHK